MTVHDALTFLPRTRVLDFPKRSTIYDHSRPAGHLFLLLSGHVKVLCTADDGTQTLVRIVPPEGFFGETSLVPASESLKESALTVEAAQAMCWSADQVIAQVDREPKLALALFDYFGKCNLVHRERIQAFMSCKTGMRVALALTQIARDIGSPVDSGALRISGLTHRAIGDYVGTTREIVTVEMNRLRRLGYVEYTRRYADVYADAMTEWMRQQGVTLGSEQPAEAAAGGRT
jgi:CRP/FNR family cyclic AMP-dependent transcriptional regulator